MRILRVVCSDEVAAPAPAQDRVEGDDQMQRAQPE
jgi:hypothetical protein